MYLRFARIGTFYIQRALRKTRALINLFNKGGQNGLGLLDVQEEHLHLHRRGAKAQRRGRRAEKRNPRGTTQKARGEAAEAAGELTAFPGKRGAPAPLFSFVQPQHSGFNSAIYCTITSLNRMLPTFSGSMTLLMRVSSSSRRRCIPAEPWRSALRSSRR